jgi:aspartate ammonia-lyase
VKAIRNLSRISGQKLIAVDDMRYAMQSNFAMARVSSALRNLALEVIRISNDLRYFPPVRTQDSREINLPGLQPGLSIMPERSTRPCPNWQPWSAFQVVGNDVAVAMAVQAGQLELNVMMPTWLTA